MGLRARRRLRQDCKRACVEDEESRIGQGVSARMGISLRREWVEPLLATGPAAARVGGRLRAVGVRFGVRAAPARATPRAASDAAALPQYEYWVERSSRPGLFRTGSCLCRSVCHRRGLRPSELAKHSRPMVAVTTPVAANRGGARARGGSRGRSAVLSWAHDRAREHLAVPTGPWGHSARGDVQPAERTRRRPSSPRPEQLCW